VTTLPNLGLVLPREGDDYGVWDAKINACLGLIDAHDHTSGKGARITPAAFDIDDDVAWGGHNITALGKLDFSEIALPSAGARSLFVSGGELYWRSTGGVNVKLTSGSTLNTSLIGGIGGDYAAVGAALDYTDADAEYTFRDQHGAWARLASGPVRIGEFGDTGTGHVEIAVYPGTTSYSLILPWGLPAVDSLVRVTTTGYMAYQNDDLPSLAFVGDATISLTGTNGRVKVSHAFETIILTPTGIVSGGTSSASASKPGAVQSASTTAYYPLGNNPLYREILSVEVNSETSANNTTYSIVAGGGYGTAGFGSDLATETTAADQAILIPGSPAPLSAGLNYFLKVVTDSGSTRHLVAAIVHYALE
jgi:hypothetical protein